MVWGALKLEIPPELENPLVACLSADSLGAAFETTGPNVGLLTIYVESPERGEALVREAGVALRRLDLDPTRCGLRVERVEDGRWVEHYHARLRPFALGAGFEVLPRPDGEAAPGRIGIRLVPGRAFGTGEHPTTRLCTSALEATVRRGQRWLDMGCGTALLSIIAVHCGATHARAVDNDPEAVTVAREVVAANGLCDSISADVGSVDGVEPGAWDGVVANIASSFFFARGRELAGLLRPGGSLIASGFLVDDVVDLERTLHGVGLVREERMSEGEWAALRFRRDEGAP